MCSEMIFYGIVSSAGFVRNKLSANYNRPTSLFKKQWTLQSPKKQPKRMYDTLEEILTVKVLRRAQIRLSVTMCGHAVTRWVVVTKGNAVFAVG